MPAWWNRSSKSKSKSKPKLRKSEGEEEPEDSPNPNPKLSRSNKKEKASSFDEALARRASNGSGPALVLGHPLPRPSLSLPTPALSGGGSASGSASSDSSSGSDEIPDLAFYKYSEPTNLPRGRNLTIDLQRNQHVAEDGHRFMVNTVLEHPRCSHLSISPKREFHMFCPESLQQQRTSSENIFNLRAANGLPLPISPKHARALPSPGSPTIRQDDMKSPFHPLPLPPNSPSSSFRPWLYQSQWKKGKLLGRGTFGHVYLGFNRWRQYQRVDYVG